MSTYERAIDHIIHGVIANQHPSVRVCKVSVNLNIDSGYRYGTATVSFPQWGGYTICVALDITQENGLVGLVEDIERQLKTKIDEIPEVCITAGGQG